MQNKRSDKKVLTENFISLALTQIITYAIPLITLPYLARTLGAEKFGLVYWAQAIMQYFICFTTFGFTMSAVREFSVNRSNKDKMNQIFSSILFIKFILILISIVILTILIFLVPKFRSEALLFYLTFFMVIGNAIYPIWYYQGIEHMKYVTFLNILSKGIFLILIFIFVKQPEDYLLVALLGSLGFIISGIIGIYLACKRFELKIVIPKKEEVIYQFRYGSEFFMANVSIMGYTNTNTFIIGLLSNPVMVAYYTAAEKIYYAIQGLAAPVCQVLYPYISQKQDIEKYKKIFYPSLLAFLLIVLFMFIFSKSFITIFYGGELVNAYKVLKILCITLCFSFINCLIGYPLLAAFGYTKVTNYSLIVASIFHIIGLFSLLMINKLNIYTIAGMTILAEAITVFYRVCAIRKYKLWHKKEVV